MAHNELVPDVQFGLLKLGELREIKPQDGGERAEHTEHAERAGHAEHVERAECAEHTERADRKEHNPGGGVRQHRRSSQHISVERWMPARIFVLFSSQCLSRYAHVATHVLTPFRLQRKNLAAGGGGFGIQTGAVTRYKQGQQHPPLDWHSQRPARLARLEGSGGDQNPPKSRKSTFWRCHQGEQEGGTGVARAWRGRGAGYRLQFGMSGAGVARAWRGHFLFPQGAICGPDGVPMGMGTGFWRSNYHFWVGFPPLFTSVHVARTAQHGRHPEQPSSAASDSSSVSASTYLNAARARAPRRRGDVLRPSPMLHHARPVGDVARKNPCLWAAPPK
eukprot:gene24236-biopygen19405